MPRPPRLHYAGAIYHAMSRGNDGQGIFVDESDWQGFLEVLSEVKTRYPFQMFAYCLMSNHFHLLVRVDRHPLSQIMQVLLTRYSNRFNFRHGRTGHLFQSRYKAIHCDKDSYLLELLRYIHLNPLRAGLVATAVDWPWSSHADYVGIRNSTLIDPKFPLSLFDAESSRARALYQDFVTVQSGTAPELPKCGDPDNQVARPDAHAELDSARSEPADSERNLQYLGEAVARETGVGLDAIQGPSRLRTITAARRVFVQRSIRLGLRTCEIAVFLSRSDSLVSKIDRRLNSSDKSKPDTRSDGQNRS